MGNTDNLREFMKKLDKLDPYLRWIVFHLPCFYFNKELNCLTVSFYDCSYVAKPYIFKEHFLDLHFDQHPKWKWLSLCGFTFWFPYTWEEIKEKTCCKLAGSDIEEYIQFNKKLDKEMRLLKKEAIDLIYYADSCATILKENGFDGKAEALTKRYVKLGRRFGLKPKNELPPENQPPLEEEPK